MLDLAKIQFMIAQSYSPQELFATLVWQRRFNHFDGEEVITDLSNYPSLWASFLFPKPIFTADEGGGLRFSGVIDMLLTMANYRPVLCLKPASSISLPILWIRYISLQRIRIRKYLSFWT